MNRYTILAAAVSSTMLLAGWATAQITVSGPATISGQASLIVGTGSYHDNPAPEVFSGGSSSNYAILPPDGIVGSGGGYGTWPAYGTYSSILFTASAGAGGNNEQAGNASDIITNGSISMGFTSSQPVAYDLFVSSTASSTAYANYSNWTGTTPATVSANVVPVVGGISLGSNAGASVLMSTAHFDSSASQFIDGTSVMHDRRVVGTAPANAFLISITAEATIPYEDNEYVYSRSGGASSTISGSVSAISSSSTPIEFDASGGPYESVSVGGGTIVAVNPDDPCGFRTNALAIDATGTFDVRDGTVVVDYAGSSPLATIQSQLASGYNGGTWNGYGIISSVAAVTPGFAVGYAEASTVGITTIGTCGVDTTAIILDYCLNGDTNLDGTVNFTDQLKLSQNYNGGSGKLWSDGDSNYDGVVNFADLLLLAQNYGLSGLTDGTDLSAFDPAFIADYRLAVSMVPEPATATLLGLTAMIGMRSRRRA